MNFEDLIRTISAIHDELTGRATKAVNFSLTVRNWLIGYYIKEFEQKGSDRASYGDHILQDLSAHLPKHEGFSYRSLKLYRQFYSMYPQFGQTMFAQCPGTVIRQTPSAQLADSSAHSEVLIDQGQDQFVSFYDTLIRSVSFSHFSHFITLEDPLKR
jgi:hypothetical protein